MILNDNIKIFFQERRTSKGGNIFNNKQDEPLCRGFKTSCTKGKMKIIFRIFCPSEGGVLHVVNGPNKDRPVQGFTVRVSDGTLLQTWPTEKGQVQK